MKSNRRAFLGILLVLLGCVFLMNNLDLIPELPGYVFSWVNIFLVLAVINLVSGRPKPAFIFGLLWLFFFLERHFYLDIHEYWPLILIAIGVSFIIKNRSNTSGITGDSYFDDVNLFGGGHKSYTSQQLQGGKSTNIFGGSTIDLRAARPVDGAVIDITTIFGGCEIIVPDDWNVSVNSTSIFGGFEDNRTPSAEKQAFTLYIKGITIFGGGELKSPK